MTTEQYAYWMQGFVELNGGKMPTSEQWQMIVEHLATVFNKVTPPLMMPKSIFPNEENKYCGNIALDVCGPSFKMPPGATGDIGNGIQIFPEYGGVINIKPNYVGNGFSGQMSHEEYKDWLKRYNIVPLEYDKGAPLDYSQTLITC